MSHMWSTTFQRFPAGKTPILGAITVAVHDWTDPRAGKSQVFDHALLERLTFAHPAVPIALYGSESIALLWWAAHRGTAPGPLASWYLGGLLAWSLFEYLMHRYSFHHAPKTPVQVALSYLSHGVHHAYPEDLRRLVMPLIVTLPIGGLIFGLCYLALGMAALPWFAGFMHGYLAYDTIHFAIHRGALPTPLGRFLRRHHLQHHYGTPDRRFGVSSPLWDLLFGTAR